MAVNWSPGSKGSKAPSSRNVKPLPGMEQTAVLLILSPHAIPLPTETAVNWPLKFSVWSLSSPQHTTVLSVLIAHPPL